MSRASSSTKRPVPSKSGCFTIVREEPLGGHPSFESLEELVESFRGESACASFLETLRFPRGFVCPRCECRQRPWRTGTGLVACPGCRTPWGLTEGTLFHGTPIPLARWFTSLWSWLEQEDGMDGASFGALLGIEDAALARAYQEKLRARMGAQTTRLSGEVQLAIAKIEPGPDDAQTVSVIMALEQRAGDAPRLRLRILPRNTLADVVRFAADVIEPGSLVVTPPWKGLGNLSRIGLLHTMRASRLDGLDSLDPSQIWSSVRLWLWSQPVQPVEPALLLDELVFRFNHRHLGTGVAWDHLIRRIVGTDASTPDPLVAAG